MAGGRERRSRERPSGSERDAQGDVRCLQAADDGVAAMASQESDGSELELAKALGLCGGAQAPSAGSSSSSTHEKSSSTPYSSARSTLPTSSPSIS